MFLDSLLRQVRAADAALTRRRDHRRILVDARTAVNYTMFAPIHAAMCDDERVTFSFVASEEPTKAGSIFRHAGPGARIISPARAAMQRFDAYVASDFMWATLPRGTQRVQMFHGVGGKYGFDAPTGSMRQWDRLFFVNERRLRNFVAAGAIDPDSPAVRLVGMPKVDCLVDGSLRRDAAIAALGLDPSRPTVLYAPTWSPASSLNTLGVDLIDRLQALPINLVVKLHDRSRDLRPRYSGGVDWMAALRPRLVKGRSVLAEGNDICPLLAGADIMVTDHSSAGFEYLLLNRPIVRIHLPGLLKAANVHPDYVELLSEAATSVTDAAGAVAAVESGLVDPSARSAARQAIAAELFYRPGSATRRSVEALYELIELADPMTHTAREFSCQPSA